MKKLFDKIFCVFCISFAVNGLDAKSFEEQKKDRMIEDLKVIKHTLEVGYAPLEWKKSYSNWDLEQEFEKSKNLISSLSPITIKDFHGIVKNFLATTQDYHVDVIFYSTESAALPFSVKSTEGRYFIDWIDPQQMPPSIYAIRVGDELVAFDERPIATVIEELKAFGNKSSNPLTDQALAEMKLTQREGVYGDRIPKGAVSVTTRSALKGKLQTYQLFWNYQPELITSPSDFLQTVHSLFSNETAYQRPSRAIMMNVAHRERLKKTGREGGLGSRKSFIPALGPQVWEHDEIKKGRPISWYAYIYETPYGQRIGYIRIPHYRGSDEDSEEFGQIIAFLDQKTDALVIDQVHNVGGYVSFQYDLASMLTTTPLKTPKHRMKITQKDVMTAHYILELLKGVQCDLDSALASQQEDDEDQVLDYQRLLFIKDFYEFTIEQWNAGHAFTDPIHLEGVDWINPNMNYQYTKPILMLINELDFSGGDFMPAIMQDNKRARLFGARTSGAGGFVSSTSFPNDNGIVGFSYTASLAERPDTQQKIENLGVTPDIEYSLTVNDLQEGYQDYVSAVNEAIQDMLHEKYSLETVSSLINFKR